MLQTVAIGFSNYCKVRRHKQKMGLNEVRKRELDGKEPTQQLHRDSTGLRLVRSVQLLFSFYEIDSG